MKQNVTKEQLEGLTAKGKKSLREWWNPKEGDKFLDYDGEVFYGQSNGFEDETYLPDKVYFKGTAGEGKETDLPLLSIGQMIEFLDERGSSKFDLGYAMASGISESYGSLTYDEIDVSELCDDLWEAVRKVLEK